MARRAPSGRRLAASQEAPINASLSPAQQVVADENTRLEATRQSSLTSAERQLAQAQKELAQVQAEGKPPSATRKERFALQAQIRALNSSIGDLESGRILTQSQISSRVSEQTTQARRSLRADRRRDKAQEAVKDRREREDTFAETGFTGSVIAFDQGRPESAQLFVGGRPSGASEFTEAVGVETIGQALINPISRQAQIQERSEDPSETSGLFVRAGTGEIGAALVEPGQSPPSQIGDFELRQRGTDIPLEIVEPVRTGINTQFTSPGGQRITQETGVVLPVTLEERETLPEAQQPFAFVPLSSDFTGVVGEAQLSSGLFQGVSRFGGGIDSIAPQGGLEVRPPTAEEFLLATRRQSQFEQARGAIFEERRERQDIIGQFRADPSSFIGRDGVTETTGVTGGTSIQLTQDFFGTLPGQQRREQVFAGIRSGDSTTGRVSIPSEQFARSVFRGAAPIALFAPELAVSTIRAGFSGTLEETGRGTARGRRTRLIRAEEFIPSTALSELRATPTGRFSLVGTAGAAVPFVASGVAGVKALRQGIATEGVRVTAGRTATQLSIFRPTQQVFTPSVSVRGERLFVGGEPSRIQLGRPSDITPRLGQKGSVTIQTFRGGVQGFTKGVNLGGQTIPGVNIKGAAITTQVGSPVSGQQAFFSRTAGTISVPSLDIVKGFQTTSVPFVGTQSITTFGTAGGISAKGIPGVRILQDGTSSRALSATLVGGTQPQIKTGQFIGTSGVKEGRFAFTVSPETPRDLGKALSGLRGTGAPVNLRTRITTFGGGRVAGTPRIFGTGVSQPATVTFSTGRSFDFVPLPRGGLPPVSTATTTPQFITDLSGAGAGGLGTSAFGSVSRAPQVAQVAQSSSFISSSQLGKQVGAIAGATSAQQAFTGLGTSSFSLLEPAALTQVAPLGGAFRSRQSTLPAILPVSASSFAQQTIQPQTFSPVQVSSPVTSFSSASALSQFSGSTTTTITPTTITPTTTVTPPTDIPFVDLAPPPAVIIGGGFSFAPGFPEGKPSKSKKQAQPFGRVPSFAAIGLNIVGRPRPRVERTGLVLRPLATEGGDFKVGFTGFLLVDEVNKKKRKKKGSKKRRATRQPSSLLFGGS